MEGESAYVLLVDTSGSMGKQKKIESAKEACAFFIDQLSKDDLVALITFDKEVKQYGGFTNDKEELKKRLGSIIEVGNATKLYDAINEASLILKDVKVERKVMVVLTDGRDSADSLSPDGSSMLFDSCLGEAILNGFPVYTIGLGYDVDKGKLKRFADETNGEYYESPTADGLKPAYEDIFKRSKETGNYVLTYTIPPSFLQGVKEGDSRNIEISVQYKEVAQKASRSYVVPPDYIPPQPGGRGNLIWIIAVIVGATGVIFLIVIWARRKPRRKEISRLEPSSKPIDDGIIDLGEMPMEEESKTSVSTREGGAETEEAFRKETGGIYEQPAVDETKVVAYLRVMKAPEKNRDLVGKRFPVYTDRATTIGRASDRDISLQNDDKVSRVHAEVCYKQKRFVIEDQGSANGTFIASQQGAKFNREGRTEIKPGYLIGLGGSYVLKLELPGGKDSQRTVVRG